jgi:hypothetical protein
VGEYLRVLARQIRPTGRQGRSFAWLSRSHALSQPGHPRPNLTGSGRSDSSCFAGTERGTGFPGPNKERDQGERAGRSRLHLLALHERRGRKKEALRGEQRADFTARWRRYSLYLPFLSSGSGAALLRRAGLRPPFGGVRRIRGSFFLPDFPIPND